MQREFQTGVQVILRVCLVKLGTVNQRKGLIQGAGHSNSSEPRLGCLDSGKEVRVTVWSRGGAAYGSMKR